MEKGFDVYRGHRMHLEQYLKELPFQSYATLTLPRRKSVEYADSICMAWLERLECYHRSPIGAVQALEVGPRRTHPHQHLLVMCAVQIDLEYAKESWMSLSGSRSRHSIKIAPYDPERAASVYVLKFHGTDFCELKLHKIEYFLPTPNGFWTRNARTRRHLRRHVNSIQSRG